MARASRGRLAAGLTNPYAHAEDHDGHVRAPAAVVGIIAVGAFGLVALGTGTASAP